MGDTLQDILGDEMEEGFDQAPVGVGSEQKLVTTAGKEVFVRSISKMANDVDVRSLFESIGQVEEVRLVRDRALEEHKGFGFVRFTTTDDADNAIKVLDGALLKGRNINVKLADARNRLFLGNLPKDMSKSELEAYWRLLSEPVVSFEFMGDPANPGRNRGFGFLEFVNHNAAESAKRELSQPTFLVKGRGITVTFADPRADQNPDNKSLYVKGLPDNPTEQMLQDLFSPYGQLEKVVVPNYKDDKRDFAFVYFVEKNNAKSAVSALNDSVFMGKQIHVAFSMQGSKREGPPRGREYDRDAAFGFPMYPPPHGGAHYRDRFPPPAYPPRSHDRDRRGGPPPRGGHAADWNSLGAEGMPIVLPNGQYAYVVPAAGPPPGDRSRGGPVHGGGRGRGRGVERYRPY